MQFFLTYLPIEFVAVLCVMLNLLAEEIDSKKHSSSPRGTEASSPFEIEPGAALRLHLLKPALLFSRNSRAN